MSILNNRPLSARVFVALLLAVLSPGSLGTALAHNHVSATQPLNVTLTYLQRTLQALHGAMDFFYRQYTHINLDAVIGTRMVEGSLKVLLTNVEETRQVALLPDDIVKDIRALYRGARDISDNAEPYVAITQPRYYQRIGPLIHDGLWELDYSSRSLSGSTPLWPYLPEESMTERDSDDCITELFGTSGASEDMCAISDSCWSRMTKLGYSQYSLSHQIFYLQIGELAGCQPWMMWKMLRHGQPGMRVLQDTFCANMLQEAESIARSGYPASRQDLFMEQAALCGMYGYWQFFRYDWLEMMLSWQDRRQGCYRWAGWPEHRMGAKHHHVVKREERRLDNGCLCHRTTVAAGALVQYIRFLVEAYTAKVSLQY